MCKGECIFGKKKIQKHSVQVTRESRNRKSLIPLGNDHHILNVGPILMDVLRGDET